MGWVKRHSIKGTLSVSITVSLRRIWEVEWWDTKYMRDDNMDGEALVDSSYHLRSL
jgi:hypothetical protein